MKLKEPLLIENPFKKSAVLWIVFSSVSVLCGIALLLMTKPNFVALRASLNANTGDQLLHFPNFSLKFLSGLALLMTGVKYLKVSLSAIFRFDPDKRITENLAADVSEKTQREYSYTRKSLLEILQTRNLELFKPTSTIGSITVRIFHRLKKLPPRYFTVSQNFVEAIIASLSPFLILTLALFLDYLEIIDMFSRNKLGWVMLLMSVSLLFSWSPFSPITDNSRINLKALVLTICSLGMLLILRTNSFKNDLPEVSGSVFFLVSMFVLLSGGLFYAFFHLLKRRIEIETTDDNLSLFKANCDVDLHPKEIHRVLSNKMNDLGSLNLSNRRYYDELIFQEGSFDLNLMHETQPLPRYAIKDSTLLHDANRFIFSGFCVSTFASLLLVVLTSSTTSVLTLTLSSILCLGLVNFGLKLIHICNLFTSEFLFQSKLITVFSKGEFKSSQVTSGRSVYDSVESKNDVTRSSMSLQIASTNITTISFLQMGKVDPFEKAARYIVSMEKDDETVAEIAKSLDQHLGEKSKIVGITNDIDIQRIKGMTHLNKKQPEEMLDKGLDGFEISDH